MLNNVMRNLKLDNYHNLLNIYNLERTFGAQVSEDCSAEEK